MIVVLLVLITLISSDATWADDNRWTTLGLYGGAGKVVVDPIDRKILFADGGQRLYRSVNAGLSWSELPVKAPILAHPLTGDLTACCFYRSTDNGANWKKTGDLPYRASLEDLELHPQKAGVLYLVTNHGFFKSTNFGGVWTKKGEGRFYSVEVNSNNGNELVAPNGCSLLKSVNGGDSWSEIFHDCNSISSLLSMSKSSPDIMYMNFGNRILRTNDAGRSWKNIQQGGLDLVVDPLNADVLYLSTGLEILVSRNGGTTWSQFVIRMLPKGKEVVISIDPKNSDHIYAGGWSFGLVKTLDGGATWKSIHRGIDNLLIDTIAVNPQNPLRIFAQADGSIGRVRRLFRTTDGGINWTAITPPLGFAARSLLFHPLDSRLLIAGGYYTSVSTNAGATWSRNDQLSDALALDPFARSTLIAGNSRWETEQGIRKSTDLGHTWRSVRANTSVASMVADPATPGVFYAGSFANLLKSTDSGVTWTAFSAGLPQAFIWSLAISTSPNEIYAGTESGIFRSTDSGQTWTSRSSGLSVGCCLITSLLASRGILYTWNRGSSALYFSVNHGESWQPFDLTGLPSQTRIYTLAADPSATNLLYMGTSRGLFTYTIR